MRKILLALALILSLQMVFAVPVPCTEQELMDSSTFVIEGIVVDNECGEAYDANQCIPLPENMLLPGETFSPMLFADCIVTIRVTESLKGDYRAGDEVQIPYFNQVTDGSGCDPIIPGPPRNNFENAINDKFRYYESYSCRFESFELIEDNPQQSDLISDGAFDYFDTALWVYIILFAIIIAIAANWFMRRK